MTRLAIAMLLLASPAFAQTNVPADALMALVKSDRRVKELLADKTIVKEIAVSGRLVNFVVRE